MCRPLIAARSRQGYLPTNSDRRAMTLERKRNEYCDLVRQSFGTHQRDDYEETIFRQVVLP